MAVLLGQPFEYYYYYYYITEQRDYSCSPVLAIQFAQASYAFDEDAGTGSTLSILYDTRPEGFTIEYSVMSTGRTATGMSPLQCFLAFIPSHLSLECLFFILYNRVT